MPEEKRPYIQALYAFSRMADDFADELNRSKEERLADLKTWEENLRQCYDGHSEHPVFIALQETVKQYDIPIDPLLDLISAFKRDVTQNRYQTFNELLDYCRCSANPVGRLVLMIFNYRDDTLFKYSDSICTALQLANFWQDLSVDRQKDRLYIPIEDLKNYGYSMEDWKKAIMNDNFTELIKFEVDRTKEIFYEGAKLPSLVAKDLQLELKMIWLGGMEILRLTLKKGSKIIQEKPKLTNISKLKILLYNLFIKDLVYFRRKKPKKNPWDLT